MGLIPKWYNHFYLETEFISVLSIKSIFYINLT